MKKFLLILATLNCINTKATKNLDLTPEKTKIIYGLQTKNPITFFGTERHDDAKNFLLKPGMLEYKNVYDCNSRKEKEERDKTFEEKIQGYQREKEKRSRKRRSQNKKAK